MRIRVLTLLAPILCTSIALLSAGELPQAPPSRTVGSVFGKAVTAADIGLNGPIDQTVRFDSRDTARWELMGRIATTFGGPVMDRFVKRQNIEATVDEIEMFKSNSRKMNARNVREWESRIAELKEKLAAPKLANEDQARLTKELAMYEKFVATSRTADVPESLARMFIVAWKTERELHRVYGGRVIFQQAGLEALDARRSLYEQAEKNGELKFDDAGVRHMFYYYANMKHIVATDEKALEKPWFFERGS